MSLVCGTEIRRLCHLLHTRRSDDFTHLNPKGSRFADGSFDVYYAADQIETTIAETAHRFTGFARDAGDPPRREDVPVLVGGIE